MQAIPKSLLILGLLVAAAGSAHAQTFKQQIVGTWSVASVAMEMNGKKTEPYGPGPRGYFMFTADDHFSNNVVRADRPKFASNNPNTGTPEENKAAMQGTISTFGTYTVDETDHTLNLHIVGSSFPNWDGTDQKRMAEITGDRMKWTNPTMPGGGAVVMLETAK
jgi:hypothetical protein